MTLIAWNRAMRMRWAMNRMETISMEASEKIDWTDGYEYRDERMVVAGGMRKKYRYKGRSQIIHTTSARYHMPPLVCRIARCLPRRQFCCSDILPQIAPDDTWDVPVCVTRIHTKNTTKHQRIDEQATNMNKPLQ